MKIPNNLIQEIDNIVERFNSKNFKKNEAKFIPVVKLGYLYLNRQENVNILPMVRLKYTGDMKNWKFAIFKYSTETFDEEEISFPGYEFIDGTIEGALKAGNATYPSF